MFKALSTIENISWYALPSNKAKASLKLKAPPPITIEESAGALENQAVIIIPVEYLNGFK